MRTNVHAKIIYTDHIRNQEYRFFLKYETRPHLTQGQSRKKLHYSLNKLH